MFGASLTNLSKHLPFDCLDHELLIATLKACGFSLTASKLVHNYISNRKSGQKWLVRNYIWASKTVNSKSPITQYFFN